MEPDAAAHAGPRQFPWRADEGADAATTISLLAGMLETELRTAQQNLPAFQGKPLHASTAMSAIGVVAGYAAQCAAADAILRKTRPRTLASLNKVSCKDGSVLYYGDEIDRHLVSGAGGEYPLSGFLRGAVLHAGHTQDEIVGDADVLRTVETAASTEHFDVVKAPDGQAPFWDVSLMLRHVWPKARAVLEHRVRPATVSKPAPVQHWPVIASVVAQQYVGLAKDIVPPPAAMAMILESAIKASKRRLVAAGASPLFHYDADLFDQKMH